MKSQKEIYEKVAEAFERLTEGKRQLYQVERILLDLKISLNLSRYVDSLSKSSIEKKDNPSDHISAEYPAGKEVPCEKKCEKTQVAKSKKQLPRRKNAKEWAVAYRETPFKNGKQIGNPSAWELCECFVQGYQKPFTSREQAREYVRNLNFVRDAFYTTKSDIENGWTGPFSEHQIVWRYLGDGGWRFAK